MKRALGQLEAFQLACMAITGHRYWLLPIVPLAWLPACAWIGIQDPFVPASAQGTLIGLPLTFLAIFLGLRVIAGEIDGRSLEIAYTVPGGCERVWWTKLAAAVLLLVAAEVPLAVATWVFFTPFPLDALYGALQAALFYLVLAMGMATLFRSETAGAMPTVLVLALNGVITGFGQNQVRVSPFWNPHAIQLVGNGGGGADPADILAWTVQNRIGFALLVTAIVALAFMRAGRRERMLDN
ncbi:MAG: hypothetical protein OXH52_04810 [Gammaproteobacteria bacterium]|nr:hypothetical protein [Gammaproteobacteria bacterium]